MYVIIVSIVITFFFDYFIASNSIIQLRFIYDVGFLMILFAFIYTSMIILNGTDISRNEYIIRVKHKYAHLFFLALSILINVKATPHSQSVR